MDPLVTIAIPDLAGSVARTTTLSSLARHTPEPHQVMLLVEQSRSQSLFSQQDDRMCDDWQYQRLLAHLLLSTSSY